ncbi:unnamed protein product, partial [marine sediment metagenome]
PKGCGNLSACPGDCIKAYHAGYYDWGQVRRAVYKRDGGRCQLCGLDLAKLERIAAAGGREARAELRRALHLPWHRFVSEAWDVDHIVPVCEAGPAKSLDELRLLCYWCHQKETAALARRRAASRHDSRRPLLEARE